MQQLVTIQSAIYGAVGAVVAFFVLQGDAFLGSQLSLRLLAAAATGLGVMVADAGGWKLVAAADAVATRFQGKVAQSAARILSYVLMALALVLALVLVARLLGLAWPRAA